MYQAILTYFGIAACYLILHKVVLGEFRLKSGSPLLVFLYFNVFLVSLPGVLILFFSRSSVDDISYYHLLSDDSISSVTYAYLYSIFVLCIGFLFINRFFRIDELLRSRPMNKVISLNALLIVIVMQLTMLFSGLLILGLENIPLLYIFQGDYTKAAVLKAEILTGVIPSGLPYIGLFFKIFLLFAPLYLMNLKLGSNLMVRSLTFNVFMFMSFFLTFIYLIHQGHKAPFFLYMLMTASMYVFYKGLNIKVFLIIVFGFLLLIVFFSASYGLSEMGYMMKLFLNRAFLSQNFGMYLIYEWIDPTTAYLLEGIPFISRFVELPLRADELVMSQLHGGLSGGNVNMNTYFLGEAYSSMGGVGYAISPWIVLIVMMLIVGFYYFGTKRSVSVFFPMLYVHLFYFLPINQSFNRMIYFTEGIFVMVSSVLLFVFFSLFVERLK